MPQPAAQPDPQQYLQSLMQAGQEVVHQFERALSAGAVIAPSDLKWPAATPPSITDLFDLQRRYLEQMAQLWSSFLDEVVQELGPDQIRLLDSIVPGSWWPDWDRWLKDGASDIAASAQHEPHVAADQAGCHVSRIPGNGALNRHETGSGNARQHDVSAG
jgi:hypothetical protein